MRLSRKIPIPRILLKEVPAVESVTVTGIRHYSDGHSGPPLLTLINDILDAPAKSRLG